MFSVILRWNKAVFARGARQPHGGAKRRELRLMFIVKGDGLWRAARSLAALWMVGAFWCGSALESKAQPNAGTIGFSATNYNVLENAGYATITIVRTNGNEGAVGVSLTPANGTAINSNDFLCPSTQMVLPDGAILSSFNIPIINHSTPQPNKYFNLYLSTPTGGATLDTNVPPLVPSNTVVTIIGNHITNSPTLFTTQNGSELVLSWSGVWLLQTATNLAGPWTNLPTASSPFTVQIGSQPAAFFRLE